MKQIFIFLLLLPLSLLAEQVTWDLNELGFTIHIAISTNTMTLNDTLKLQVLVTHPSSYKGSPEEIIRQLLWHANPLEPRWNLLKRKIVTTSKGFQLDLELAPITSGIKELSFFNVVFHGPENHDKVFSTPLFEIDVKPIDPLVTEMESTAPLVSLSNPLPLEVTTANRQKINDPQRLQERAKLIEKNLALRSFPWTFLFLVTMGSLVWVISRYWNPFKVKKSEEFELSIQQRALQDLEKIQKEELPKKGLYKDYYGSLTEVLRRYLEEHNQLFVTSKTTEEFLRELPKGLFQPEMEKRVVQFLREADQIKFANVPASLEQSKQAYELLHELVLTKSGIEQNN